MRFLVVFKILGMMLMLLSASNLPPIVVGLIYGDGGIPAFIFGFLITFLFGFMLWFFSRNLASNLKTRDGFLVVSLLWVVLSLFSAIPLLMTLYPKMAVTDAVFEAVSGLTTTGASVMANLNTLPHALLYYRQQLALLGGIGIIVLAIAVLPMLGVGGMQLYRAEVAGPMKSDKLTPRLAQTAKALWTIYFGLALIAIIVFHLVGMKWFDAIAASFSVVSTGGFSIHDTGFAYYHSVTIDAVCVIFMLLGGTNFALHFQLLRQRSPLVYFRDPEFRFYIFVYFVASIIIILTLSMYNYPHFGRNVLNAVFSVVSIGTTTGLTTTNFNLWPTFLPFLIMFVALIGGCAGSTSGGIKMVRVLVLREQTRREFYRLIHPKAVFSVKLGKQDVPEKTIQAVWGFVTVFMVLYVVLLLGLLATGLDIRTAFGAVTASLSNTGVGIGGVFVGFESLGDPAKWICIFSMIVGRLEIFTIMVLFLPSYWRA